MEVKSTDQIFLLQQFYVLMHVSKIVIEISLCLEKWIYVMTQMFLQVFCIKSTLTESAEEVFSAFSRFIIQGEIIAPYVFAGCALHGVYIYICLTQGSIYLWQMWQSGCFWAYGKHWGDCSVSQKNKVWEKNYS